MLRFYAVEYWHTMSTFVCYLSTTCGARCARSEELFVANFKPAKQFDMSTSNQVSVSLLKRLEKAVDDTEWRHENLTAVCRAIGSFSGTLDAKSEQTFFVRVIKVLILTSVSKQGNKDDTACIASNIMHIVSQYMRILRLHWKFLKVVVEKLFEFMHELHPGVQEMSCDTFLKIVNECTEMFMPFIHDILDRLPNVVSDLEQAQLQVVYEAMNVIIQSEPSSDVRQALVDRLNAAKLAVFESRL